MLKTLKFDIPDKLVELWGSEERMERALKKDLIEIAVLKLVSKGEISSRKGAELLKIDWDDFLKLMSKNKIPYFNYTEKELDEGLANLGQ